MRCQPVTMDLLLISSIHQYLYDETVKNRKIKRDGLGEYVVRTMSLTTIHIYRILDRTTWLCLSASVLTPCRFLLSE